MAAEILLSSPAAGADNGPEHTEDFGPPAWFQNADTDEAVSAKGLKSDGDITISGGSITIDSMDDAVHCVGTLTVSDEANLTIETGDDGFHSDDTLTIEGGKINILRSYEGLEAVFINISGGETTLVASDDGLNAAGGTTADTDFAFMGPPGMGGEPETLEDATYYVHISGGKLTVDAGGDGLDSNGAMFVDGGEVYVSGPAGSMNGRPGLHHHRPDHRRHRGRHGDLQHGGEFRQFLHSGELPLRPFHHL